MDEGLLVLLLPPDEGGLVEVLVGGGMSRSENWKWVLEEGMAGVEATRWAGVEGTRWEELGKWGICEVSGGAMKLAMFVSLMRSANTFNSLSF